MKRVLIIIVALIFIYLIYQFSLKPGSWDLTGEIIGYTPNPAYVGDKVSFTYVVRNLGKNTLPTGSYEVEFYVDDKLVSFDRAGNPLTPGGGVTYSRSEGYYDFIPDKPGKYSYILILDPKNTFKETNEDNNKIIGEITVLKR